MAKKPIEQYSHKGKTRINNPPVGLVTKDTEPTPPTAPKKTYAYDPNLDPRLEWAGRAERLSFTVPTVSLHVHERIDPKTIIEAVRAKNGNAAVQPALFETAGENPPLRDAIDFYRHPHHWANRLIAGDSLLVMNSLLEKEGMAGKVQMVYIDPPYGIKYGSNFQPFVNNRDVKDGKDDDLIQQPEMLKAFRDIWEVGIHSYLSYLRDTLWLAKDLLNETGSCFVQISDENVHHAREIMDEVFGPANFMGLITFVKTAGATVNYLPSTADYIVWYAKGRDKVQYHQLYSRKQFGGAGAGKYDQVELPEGDRRPLSREEKEQPDLLPTGSHIYRLDNLTSQSEGREKGEGAACWFPVTLDGVEYRPSIRGRWKTNEQGMSRLVAARRVQSSGTNLAYVRFIEDFPVFPISNVWDDVGGGVQSRIDPKIYVVQTGTGVIERCMLMTTVPGDIVIDPTCGSGTTALVAEQWGRRWITCDTSRVSIALAKQRLMTQVFAYYTLAHAEDGVGKGFVYETVPHVTLKSIAQNPQIRSGMSRRAIDVIIQKCAEQETLYDEPEVDSTKARITGPFTVEAVPAPVVRSIGEIEEPPPQPVRGQSPNPLTSPGVPGEGERRIPGDGVTADASIARSGPTLRHTEWRDELLTTGARGENRELMRFARLETLAGFRWLQAEGQLANSGQFKGRRWKEGERVVVSFGSEYAPLDKRQVEEAWQEARLCAAKPAVLVFAAFQFDPEAAKDIEEMLPERIGMTLFPAQMNTDLLTQDLKKKRSSNESFWLVGQPDVEVRRIAKGEDKGKYQVEVRGFDYYNPKTGSIESGDTSKIAMWMLDTDYDGRAVYPRQVFFPMAGDKEGWAKLAKNLRAEIDAERIEAYRGTVSLPFEAGVKKRVAVKIVDDRGIESLKIVEL